MGDSDLNGNVIVTNELNFRYGKIHALKNVNLKVAAGSIYGFLGPNGAGKTTMIKAMLGLLKTPSGSVEIFGREFHSNRVSILSRIGTMVETPSLYPALSGFENVEIVRILRGIEKDVTWKVIDTVNLRKDALRKVSQYSTGMKQRLALAIAIMGKPDLVILDEPMNGLDPSGIIEIREFLLNLNRQYGTTLFISSHILSEIEKIATHIGIINRGVLKFQGPYKELAGKFTTRSVHLVTGSDEAAFGILVSSGIKAEIRNDGLFFNSDSGTGVAAIVRKLSAEGIDIFEVTPETNDLEDIFIDVIKN